MSYLVREPDALIGPVRFDEREVETGHGREIEAPANERAGYRWTRPKPPRHFSTLLFSIVTCTPIIRGTTVSASPQRRRIVDAERDAQKEDVASRCGTVS